MTPLLIEELRRLRDAALDAEDYQLLSALIGADEASQAEPTEEAHPCQICQRDWAPILLDHKERCPDCVLVIMHDCFQDQRWKYSYMEGYNL